MIPPNRLGGSVAERPACEGRRLGFDPQSGHFFLFLQVMSPVGWWAWVLGMGVGLLYAFSPKGQKSSPLVLSNFDECSPTSVASFFMSILPHLLSTTPCPPSFTIIYVVNAFSLLVVELCDLTHPPARVVWENQGQGASGY